MKKRLLIVPVVAVVLIVSFVLVAIIATLARTVFNSSFVPIEDITGINEKAELKAGHVVNSGLYFPSEDRGMRAHGGRVAGVDGSSVGLPVTDIRIIDVYGDMCTIIFTCTDDHELYEAENYPLSNLRYDASKVSAANDGIKSRLVNTGYTIYSNKALVVRLVLFVVGLIATWVVGVIVIRKLMVNERESR